jgi:hypothetical protein
MEEFIQIHPQKVILFDSYAFRQATDDSQEVA